VVIGIDSALDAPGDGTAGSEGRESVICGGASVFRRFDRDGFEDDSDGLRFFLFDVCFFVIVCGCSSVCLTRPVISNLMVSF